MYKKHLYSSLYKPRSTFHHTTPDPYKIYEIEQEKKKKKLDVKF